MNIILHRTSDPFARVPRGLLEDNRLSWQAKGMMAYLLGKPELWKIRRGDLERRSADGQFVVRSTLSELRKAGYSKLEKHTNENGQCTEWVTLVSDAPIFVPEVEKPDVGKPHVVNPPHSKKEHSKNKDTKKESTKERSSFYHSNQKNKSCL